MVETNFEFYKRVTDDERLGKFVGDWLFEQYRQRVEEPAPGPRPPRALDAVVEAVVRQLDPRKVILFGSAARGR